ncbi:pyrroline-5-carboxylate reductase [Bacillus sp. HMF5848]|uniref:pyrroline-5-carboxylate reductase n=1 Tax=Bacillus sp. HMF5848 TaxID=2495421 RepID=UPI000F7895ED|nr:pyrroline-5-carboxylate reductase [Bacillus sp. HMF5848]RSK27130.1 pyrroline-5-carboxylate reductase [Bacillus sp. HMF5848]
MLKDKTVAFLGAGNMAEAMVAGMVSTNVVPREKIFVTNRSNIKRLQQIKETYNVTIMSKTELSFDKIDVLFLAMKPKDVDTVLASLKHSLHPDTIVLSVLAGITTAHLEAGLVRGQSVLRVMPNTSSTLQESATAISAGTHATTEHIRLAEELLQSIGKVYTIPETQMDIFTGIAGSGPAYFYYLMEHMEKAGVEGGLEPKLAREIGAQTILGAAKMMVERTESPFELRQNVTSPNGTTAAGLEALSKNGGGNAIKQAIKSAERKSKEISAKLKGMLIAQ